MVHDHDWRERRGEERASANPLVLRLEQDGTGSASFDWPQVVDALTSEFERHVDAALGRSTRVLGMRFVDADGRAVNGPVPSGVVLVGFTTSQAKESYECISSDD